MGITPALACRRGYVPLRPSRFGALLAVRRHFLHTHSLPTISTCLSQTAAPQRAHVATGDEARAARARFGPPHCGHSPAALDTDLATRPGGGR
jgi:hypothetical protein